MFLGIFEWINTIDMVLSLIIYFLAFVFFLLFVISIPAIGRNPEEKNKRILNTILLLVAGVLTVFLGDYLIDLLVNAL